MSPESVLGVLAMAAAVLCCVLTLAAMHRQESRTRRRAPFVTYF